MFHLQAGRTPLHEAAAKGHLAAAMFLVHRGADVNRAERSICGPPAEIALELGRVQVRTLADFHPMPSCFSQPPAFCLEIR